MTVFILSCADKHPDRGKNMTVPQKTDTSAPLRYTDLSKKHNYTIAIEKTAAI